MLGKHIMPVVFIGHGSPENAVEDNGYTKNWRKLASKIPKPKAIVSISAHWVEEGRTSITSMEKPRTIHDFYGFPEELYKIRYDAVGSPQYAQSVIGSVKTVKVRKDIVWGLDHGTWSVLVNMYPKADIPVLQLSLDYRLSLEKHFQIGKELRKMREQGVLILGSGNIVHNLMKADLVAPPYAWAIDFDKFVKERLERIDYNALINYKGHKSASLAQPTNEHYLPLLYVIGAAGDEDPQFFNESIFASSISMRCVVFGARKFSGGIGMDKPHKTNFQGMVPEHQV